MTTFQERLKQFIAFKSLNNYTFELACGLSNGTVRNIRRGMTSKCLDKISKSYPELNMVWLETGEGEMIRGTGTTITTNTSGHHNNVNAGLCSGSTLCTTNDDAIRRLQEEVERLREENKRKDEEIKRVTQQNNSLMKLLSRLIPSKDE